MTTMAEGSTVPSQIQRTRDLLRDRGQNGPDRQQFPVSDTRLTALTHETLHLAASDRTGQQGVPPEASDALRQGLPPELKDGQAHNDASSSASARRGPGQGNGKGTGRPGLGG